MTIRPNILILGAGSLITPWLTKRLIEKGWRGQCYSRTKIDLDRASNFIWQVVDSNCPENFHPRSQSIVISLLPLWLLTPLLPRLKDCDCLQLIAFSTTSIFGKSTSSDPAEQNLVQKIKNAEKDIVRSATQQGLPWTILRPTLIYDGCNDRNISAMAQFIKKWRILPLARPASGLRQPVHADDLAAAVVATLQNSVSFNRCFDLGGGEILTYRQMAQRVFEALGKHPRILFLPPVLIRVVCGLLNLVTRKGPNAAMFTRMNQDLIYDLTNAQQALNYTPRRFRPEFYSD